MLIIVVAFLVYLIYKYYKSNDLFKKVKWCISYDSFSVKPKTKMLYQIIDLQQEMSVEEKYSITKEEADIVIKILESFQQDLVQKYFDEVLPYDCKVTEKVYFVISLNKFLKKHQCKKEFNGNEMFTSKNYKEYGTWGVTSFSATYVLTDYAVTYYKLLYITQLYYNKLLNINNTNTTKKALDTREIDVNNF